MSKGLDQNPVLLPPASPLANILPDAAQDIVDELIAVLAHIDRASTDKRIVFDNVEPRSARGAGIAMNTEPGNVFKSTIGERRP